jgi:hypothetical protein
MCLRVDLSPLVKHKKRASGNQREAKTLAERDQRTSTGNYVCHRRVMTAG